MQYLAVLLKISFPLYFPFSPPYWWWADYLFIQDERVNKWVFKSASTDICHLNRKFCACSRTQFDLLRKKIHLVKYAAEDVHCLSRGNRLRKDVHFSSSKNIRKHYDIFFSKIQSILYFKGKHYRLDINMKQTHPSKWKQNVFFFLWAYCLEYYI